MSQLQTMPLQIKWPTLWSIVDQSCQISRTGVPHGWRRAAISCSKRSVLLRDRRQSDSSRSRGFGATLAFLASCPLRLLERTFGRSRELIMLMLMLFLGFCLPGCCCQDDMHTSDCRCRCPRKEVRLAQCRERPPTRIVKHGLKLNSSFTCGRSTSLSW